MQLIKKTLVFVLNRLLAHRYIIWKNNNTNCNEVCLTFDDGPSPYTEKILDILDAHHIRAIFFLIGDNVEKNHILARSIVDRGHIVGMHGYHHTAMTNMTVREFIQDLSESERVFGALCDSPVRIYRPPYGSISLLKMLVLWRKGYKIVMWSKDIKDFDSESGEDQLQKMKDVSVRPGDIFLFHDTCRITTDTLDTFIKILRNKSIGFGFRWVC